MAWQGSCGVGLWQIFAGQAMLTLAITGIFPDQGDLLYLMGETPIFLELTMVAKHMVIRTKT